MACEQNMTQANTQAAIEAAKVAIMAVTEAQGPTKSRQPVQVMPRASGQALR